MIGPDDGPIEVMTPTFIYDAAFIDAHIRIDGAAR